MAMETSKIAYLAYLVLMFILLVHKKSKESGSMSNVPLMEALSSFLLIFFRYDPHIIVFPRWLLKLHPFCPCFKQEKKGNTRNSP